MAQERLAPGGRLRYSRSSETDKKHLTAVPGRAEKWDMRNCAECFCAIGEAISCDTKRTVRGSAGGKGWI